jgi:hypothetical protein
LFQEYASEARHHEQQRATLTGFFSALAAGVLSVVGLDEVLSVADIPAALFLIVIGVFGCIFSAKQYERFYVCMERARQYRLALQDAVPGSNIIELKRTADRKALERFPRLHVWRLGYFGSLCTLSLQPSVFCFVFWLSSALVAINVPQASAPRERVRTRRAGEPGR